MAAANSQPGPATGSAGAARGTGQFTAAAAAGAAQATDAPGAAVAAPAVGPPQQGGAVAADQAGRRESAGAELQAGGVGADQAGTPQTAGSGRQAGAAGSDQAGRAQSARSGQQAATAAATHQPGRARSPGGRQQGPLAAPPGSTAAGAVSPAAGTLQQVLQRGRSSLRSPDGADATAAQSALVRSPSLRRGLSVRQRAGSTTSQVSHLRKARSIGQRWLAWCSLSWGLSVRQHSGVSVALSSLLEGSAVGQDLRGVAFQVRGLKAWGGAVPAWPRGRLLRLRKRGQLLRPRSDVPASQVRLQLQMAPACSVRPEQVAALQAAMDSVPLMRGV